MKTRSPAYVVAIALALDAMTLIFRRVRRSPRKSFQVSCVCELEAVEPAAERAFAEPGDAPGADDAHLIAILTGRIFEDAREGRSVRGILLGRVEVEKGDAAAQQGAISAGCKRTVKALA